MPTPLATTLPDAVSQQRWRPSPLLVASAVLHGVAVGGVVVAPRLWPWALGAAVTNHALLAVAGMSPGSRLLGPVIRRLPGATDGTAAVALTFDDGPDPEVTPQVLAALAAAGARASFFLVGERAARHPELVRAIAAQGHRVENHTWSHPATFALLGRRAQGNELDRAQRTLTSLTGRSPRYVRAPAGLRNPLLDPLIHRRGLRLVAWTRRGFDKADGDRRRVLRRLTRGLAAGDILLLHDGRPAATRQGRPVTLEVLPELLAALERQELVGKPLPEPVISGAARATDPPHTVGDPA